MAHDSEEHNPQQTRGRNGVGRSRKKNQQISKGDVPKQKERKRGRPCAELSEKQRKEKHNTGCRAYRKKKNALLRELQDFTNEFQEEFGNLRPKSLKEILSKLGVPEEVLEGIRKGTSWEELWKVWQNSKDKMEEDLSDGCGLWYYGRSAAMNEPMKQDTAEFSRFQQTEIKQETMCEKFEVTEEGLEDKEKRTFYSEECLEKRTKFLFEDEMTEEPSDVGNDELTKTYKEYEALIGSESTTSGSEDVAMNEPIGLDDLQLDDEIISSLSPDEDQVSKDAAMDEPINLEKFPPISDYLLSIGSGEGLRASEQAKEPEPIGMEPAVVQHASQDNISKGGEKEALTSSAAASDQECNIAAGIGKQGQGNSSSGGRWGRISRESKGSLSKKRSSYGQRKLAPNLSKKRELRR